MSKYAKIFLRKLNDVTQNKTIKIDGGSLKMLAWQENFPKGYGHTSISFLKQCSGYETAKTGDLDAARFVVSKCVKHVRFCVLRENFPSAVLIPVSGVNKLPEALAQAIGLPIWRNVRLVHRVKRKMLSAIERLLHKPEFAGYVDNRQAYILVDDIITQGGTVAALREFVLSHGGKVVAVVALAFAIGSHAIAPLRKHIVRLFVKFGKYLICLLRRFGIISTIEELTNSQAKYLLRFASVGNIAKKLKQTVARQV